MRRAGVLLHPTSLPGDGPLGYPAQRFLEFLHAGGFACWQMLPINPAAPDGSPYQSESCHAADPRLLSLEPAVLGLDVGGVRSAGALAAAFETQADASRRAALAAFRQREAGWLEDYALYRALKQRAGGAAWWDWPAPWRGRDAQALVDARERCAREREAVVLEQFLLEEQWQALRAQARARGIALIGDLPMFVAADSCEVWSRPGLFRLAPDGRAAVVAGVPPDYFSVTGQRWGNPVYAWEAHRREDFAWWLARVRRQLEWFDLLRIDHFRGLAATWEIPAACDTAEHGRWVDVPGDALLARLADALGELPFIAEDLGTITPDVVALRARWQLPGMNVLQFAFDSDAANPYLPHNHRRRALVCTGTHDNDTTLGWFTALDDARRTRVLDYLGQPGEAMPWPLIRAALASVAELAVVPLQDLLGLGSEARMNVPGTASGNWVWRCAEDVLDDALAARCAALNVRYGRSVTARS